MANEQNLRPPYTPNEAREFGKKGGYKSGQSRRRKKEEEKTIAGNVRRTLNTPITDEKQLEVIRKSGIPVPEKPRYVHFLVASAVMHDIKKGGVDVLLKYAELLGENTAAESGENGMLADLIDGLIEDDDDD